MKWRKPPWEASRISRPDSAAGAISRFFSGWTGWTGGGDSGSRRLAPSLDHHQPLSRHARSLQMTLVIKRPVVTFAHPFPKATHPRMTLGNFLSVDQILPEMQSKERW